VSRSSIPRGGAAASPPKARARLAARWLWSCPRHREWRVRTSVLRVNPALDTAGRGGRQPTKGEGQACGKVALVLSAAGRGGGLGRGD